MFSYQMVKAIQSEKLERAAANYRIGQSYKESEKPRQASLLKILKQTTQRFRAQGL